MADMSFLEEFQANLDSLPNILQKKYALLRDLDKSLQGLIKQNEQRCEQEMEDIKQDVKSGISSSKPSPLRFSDEALDEQKHSIRIADEKVALAVQAYDLVDTHIQQLDQYLKKIDEELRRERDVVSGLPTSSIDGSIKSGRGNESGKGGRKKTRQATAAAAAAAAISAATEVAIQAVSNPIGTELDLPLDPNEPTYCFCNQVSFGEMVACDNPDCKIEWFHFGCVGLKEQPKGKWFCSDCAVSKSRRKAS